jgi:hypothetical protein
MPYKAWGHSLAVLPSAADCKIPCLACGRGPLHGVNPSYGGSAREVCWRETVYFTDVPRSPVANFECRRQCPASGCAPASRHRLRTGVE